jgi:hypothetical protein
MPRPFPVLPIDDDRELDGDADENNQMLANRSPHRRGSNVLKESSRKLTTSSPLFAPGPTSTPLGPKSALPTIEESMVRLGQISSEIQKAQIMFDSTTNGEVRSACRRRISKLANERRIHQIVHERHRILTMSRTTTVISVRVACEERLRQLMSELESLEASGGVSAGTRDESGGRSKRRDSPGGAANDEDAGDDDGGWYGRLLDYVGGAEVTHDETLSRTPRWEGALPPRWRETSRTTPPR